MIAVLWMRLGNIMYNANGCYAEALAVYINCRRPVNRSGKRMRYRYRQPIAQTNGGKCELKDLSLKDSSLKDSSRCNVDHLTRRVGAWEKVAQRLRLLLGCQERLQYVKVVFIYHSPALGGG